MIKYYQQTHFYCDQAEIFIEAPSVDMTDGSFIHSKHCVQILGGGGGGMHHE